jgi:Mce-associated membrane protein
MTVEDTPLVEDVADGSATDRPGDRANGGRLRRVMRRMRRLPPGKFARALLALVAMTSVASAIGLLFFEYRSDRATDTAAARSVIAAAADGTVAVLSYSPDTLGRDFASAKTRLTGDFLSYYSQFTQQFVAPAAKKNSVKASAVVLRAAVSELSPNSAVVLVFVNQSTVSKDRPEATVTPSSVLITLTKTGGSWLISAFNPL